MIRRNDDPPAESWDDEHCAICGMEIDQSKIETGDEPEYDGFCSHDCRQTQVDWQSATNTWDRDGRKKGEPAPAWPTLPVIRPIFTMLREPLMGDTPEAWSRACYKGTGCGAWLRVLDAQTIQVGSIVEGVDYDADTVTLTWPFTIEQFWAGLQEVEDSATEIWCATHGCETCAKHFGIDLDDEQSPAWAECPDCDGEGVVI